MLHSVILVSRPSRLISNKAHITVAIPYDRRWGRAIPICFNCFFICLKTCTSFSNFGFAASHLISNMAHVPTVARDISVHFSYFLSV
jgi:hypothetical protein